MDIAGAVVLVTGGASGIGAATVRALAARGGAAVVADLDEARGRAVADEVGGHFVRVDVTSTEDIVAAVDRAQELGPLRVLVNSAGIAWAQRTVGRDGTYQSAADLDAFTKVIAVNLVGAYDCARIAATAMGRTQPLNEDGERGVIVNLASVAAFDGQVGQAAYAASKGGVVGLTLPLARDLAAIGVRVNTLAPGLIDTPIYGDREAGEAFKVHLLKDVLFPRRLGGAAEVAEMIVAVVTNSYLNAETIRVDAGVRLQPR